MRQLLYPREFRVAPPNWGEDLLPELQRLAEAVRRAPAPSGDGRDPLDPRFVSNLGTGLWRVRSRMTDPSDGRPLYDRGPAEGMGRPFRHLESVEETVREAGVEIQDHTGDPYRDGLALRVLTFQPTADLEEERVTETIKPSVYYRGQLVQAGKVIVGRPLRPDEEL